MIPTRSKSKLPKTLSYPLGAEAISEALADAPHASEMSISFNDQAVWPASEFQRLVREKLPYHILTVGYQPPLKPGRSAPNTLVESGWYEGHWSITVYPVRRELRSLAGQLLREQGVAAVVAWLRSSSRVGWNTRRHQIALVFNPADSTLSVTQEDGV
jgi:hypothetical protein